MMLNSYAFHVIESEFCIFFGSDPFDDLSTDCCSKICKARHTNFAEMVSRNAVRSVGQI